MAGLDRRAARATLAATLIACLAASGCSILGGAPATQVPVTLKPQPTAEPGRSYDRVMAIAVGTNGQPGDIDRFWRTNLPLMDPTAVYEPPTDFDPTPHGAKPDNACRSLTTNNAYYCPDDGSITWDVSFFQRRQESIGDLAPLVIMAHEWGHRIQATWRNAQSRRAKEAQSDCYSGLYIDDAERHGILDEADYQESIQTWYSWGTDEYDKDSWFSEEEHGPGQARAWAFISGWITGDPIYCVDFANYAPAKPATYDGYTLRIPPGTKFTAGASRSQAFDTLQGARATAYVQARPELRGTATELLPDLAREWLQQGTTRTIDVIDAFSGALGGSGGILRFEQSVTRADGTVTTFHGVLGLHVRDAGGGFLIEVATAGPAPTETAGSWEPIGDYLYLLMIGLCPENAATYVCSEAA
jgi:hypothetical protein